MDYQEAMQFLERTPRTGPRLGLERMIEVLALLGSPEKKIETIHVAGTNGKGSICAYSAYMLASAGKRVGFFCSPYVYDFGERIRILDGRDPEKKWARDFKDGQISEADIATSLTTIRETLAQYETKDSAHPTHFEMLTLMAFLHFANKACDALVIETGLGGRIDSTNVIPPPKVAVITAIGIDHTRLLGNTYLDIAKEKAGILKAGTQTLCMYDQYLAIPSRTEAQEVLDFFSEQAIRLEIRMEVFHAEEVEVLHRDLQGQRFTFAGQEFTSKLLPPYEVYNAAVAIQAVCNFLPTITWPEIQAGIASCYWPARVECLREDPLVIIDGGHNPQGVLALRSSLDELLDADTKEVHVCSIMQDKDHEQMLQLMLRSPRIRRIYFTATSGITRATKPEELSSLAKKIVKDYNREQSIEIYVSKSVEDAAKQALEYAEQHAAAVVAWGTFYQATDFRNAIVNESV